MARPVKTEGDECAALRIEDPVVAFGVSTPDAQNRKGTALRAMAVGWLSGRNGLLCLVCGLGALHFHLSWRRTGSPRLLASAVLLFALGLGCGEAALGTLAYIAAWHLVLDEGSWRKRLLPLTPYAGLVVLWRILYIAAGFGTRGSPLPPSCRRRDDRPRRPLIPENDLE